MSALLDMLGKKMPRKLASASPSDLAALGRATFDFSGDTFEWLRNLRTLLANLEEDMAALQSDIDTTVAGVSSVFTRTGAVVAVAGDYAASLVTNDSVVAGAHVSDALNTLNTADGTLAAAIAAEAATRASADSSEATTRAAADSSEAATRAAAVSAEAATRAAADTALAATKLDAWAAPDDNTSLNVTTGHHGLAPKGTAVSGAPTYWRSDWTLGTPASGFPTTISADTTIPDTYSVVVSGPFEIATGIVFTLGDDARLEVLGNRATFDTWVPDAPPLVASAYDDEFPGLALDAKWSTWDPATILSKAVKNGRVGLTSSGDSTVRWAGIYQAAPPASEYAFAAKVSISCATNEIVVAAPFVSESVSGSPTTADILSAEIFSSTAGATGWISRRWSAYNGTASGASNTMSNRSIHSVYVMGRVTGTTVSFDYSDDGISWYVLQGSFAFGSVPTHFGLGIMVQTAGVTRTVYYDFFRVMFGGGVSTFDTNTLGRMLSI